MQDRSSGGTGIDTVVVTTGANTINVGGGTTANTVTVGAAGLNTVTTTSTGADTLVISAAQTTGGFYTSLRGWAACDKLDFTAVDGAGVAEATLGAKITLSGSSNFADYLDAVTATDNTAVGEINWFQFGGNTYVTVDAANSTTYVAGTDSVVELVGLVDLSGATATTAGIVVLV